MKAKPARKVYCKLQDLGGGPESELVVKSELNEKQSWKEMRSLKHLKLQTANPCYGKAQGSKM